MTCCCFTCASNCCERWRSPYKNHVSRACVLDEAPFCTKALHSTGGMKKALFSRFFRPGLDQFRLKLSCPNWCRLHAVKALTKQAHACSSLFPWPYNLHRANPGHNRGDDLACKISLNRELCANSACFSLMSFTRLHMIFIKNSTYRILCCGVSSAQLSTPSLIKSWFHYWLQSFFLIAVLMWRLRGHLSYLVSLLYPTCSLPHMDCNEFVSCHILEIKLLFKFFQERHV